MRLAIRALTVCVAFFAVSSCSSEKQPTAPTSTTAPPATTTATGTATAPTATPTPTAPTTTTLSGRVTATTTGQALTGAAVSISGYAPAQIDANGSFSLTLPSQSRTYQVGILGDRVYPRIVNVAVNSTRSVSIDAIPLGAGFDPAFYGQFIRNSYDGDGQRSLRRWTTNPSIYLRTVDQAGKTVGASTLSAIESAFTALAPAWTGGKIRIAAFERGTGDRYGQAGWITVRFTSASNLTYCGQAQIAVDGGWIEYNLGGLQSGYTCRVCPSESAVDYSTIRHELGHALGFYHTDGRADVMYSGGSWNYCNMQPSSRELYHAAIAYSRPVGNTAPDTDPSSALATVPGDLSQATVSCPLTPTP